MIAICEGALVVVAPPGGSISFTTDQLDQAETYGQRVSFRLKMLRRQAQHKHGRRGEGPCGRERAGS